MIIKNLSIKILSIMILFSFTIIKSNATDYSKPQNWVINSSTQKEFDFDVFYIYPTLFKTESPELFDWSKPEYKERAEKFTRAQTDILFNKKHVRIFAPFIRQADLTTIINYIDIYKRIDTDYHKTLVNSGIQDTIDSLNYYLKHYNNGKPFILLGHSQGAVDLLYGIKEVNLGENFLAGYLIGMPKTTKENLTFKNIHPAENKSDLGVIISWNTQKNGVPNKYFQTQNGYVINPLNWKTDETKASKFKNFKSEFYNNKKNKFFTKHFITGAKIDSNNGVLLLDLPTNSNYDSYGLMGKGVYHTSDVWVFSNAISKNANHRYNIYKKKLKKQNQLKCKKYSNCELGDLVGDDVQRIYFSKYFIDYHTNDFSKESVLKFAQQCIEEGVKKQYQMDCCLINKMYLEQKG